MPFGPSYIFISSGLHQCWSNAESIYKFIKTKFNDQKQSEILNELFYEVKTPNRDFLTNDAVASILQVDKNAFFQV